VAVEDPGYPLPRYAFQAQGVKVVPVRVDADGLVVDDLPDDVKLVYVTPSHQFPLGMAMSRATAGCRCCTGPGGAGAAILEDDYDSEFRFSGRPIEPLQSLDRYGHVIYVGTFAKVMLPTLRLGFLVTPPSLRTALHRAKFVADWHSPIDTQAALASFIDEGGLARHIRRMRQEYLSRHEHIAGVLAKDFPELEVVPSEAGLHLSALAPHSTSEEVVRTVLRAHEAGASVGSLSAFSIAQQRAGFVIGYGGIASSDIDDGMRVLRAALD